MNNNTQGIHLEHAYIVIGVSLIIVFFSFEWINFGGFMPLKPMQFVEGMAGKVDLKGTPLGSELKNWEALFSYSLYLIPLGGFFCVLAGFVRNSEAAFLGALLSASGLFYTAYYIIDELDKSSYGASQLTWNNINAILSTGYWLTAFLTASIIGVIVLSANLKK